MDVRVGLWRRLSTEELMLLNCGVGEDSWESLGLQGDPTNPFWKRSALGFLWKEWCWSWNSSTLATWCKELTHCKTLWCWEGLGTGGKGTTEDEMAGWHHQLDGCEFEWTLGAGDGQGGLVCCDSCSPRVGHDWATELNWTEWSSGFPYFLQFKSEFGNKEFMIWATVSSWSCFCWLYRASPFLAAKNIINLILILAIWWCPCVELLLEEGVCYDQRTLLAKLY